MFNEQMKIKGLQGMYKIGDIIEINSRKWVVTAFTHPPTIYELEPLENVLAKNTYIEIDGEHILIADYIKESSEVSFNND